MVFSAAMSQSFQVLEKNCHAHCFILNKTVQISKEKIQFSNALMNMSKKDFPIKRKISEFINMYIWSNILVFPYQKYHNVNSIFSRHLNSVLEATLWSKRSQNLWIFFEDSLSIIFFYYNFIEHRWATIFAPVQVLPFAVILEVAKIFTRHTQDKEQQICMQACV